MKRQGSRVLVATPTYFKGEPYLAKFIERVKELTGPKKEVLLVDSSPDESYFKKLSRIKGITVLKSKFVPGERGLENLAEAENMIRDYFLQGDYDYCLSLEHDIIPPKAIIEQLMAADKPVVGAIYTIGGKWLVFDRFDDDGRFYRHEGIEKMKGLVKTWDCGLGCVLIKREVLERVKFRTGKFPYHPDYYFYIDLAKKGIPVYVVPEIQVEHLNKEIDEPNFNFLQPADKDLELINCNFCGHKNYEILFSQRGNSTGKMFNIVRCKRCQLVYVNPRLGKKAIKRLYSDDYFQGKGFDRTINYLEDFNKNKSSQEKELDFWMQKQSKPGAKFLDVGCGLGLLLKKARQSGFKTYGVEFSPFAAKYAKTTCDHLFQGNLEEANFASNQFDLITAIEFIEHHPDPLAFLIEVRRILKPEGIIFFKTANLEGYCQQGNPYIMPEGHLYYFTARKIFDYLKKAGFKKIISPYNDTYFNKETRLFNLLNKLRIAKTELPSGLLAKALLKINCRKDYAQNPKKPGIGIAVK